MGSQSSKQHHDSSVWTAQQEALLKCRYKQLLNRAETAVAAEALETDGASMTQALVQSMPVSFPSELARCFSRYIQQQANTGQKAERVTLAGFMTAAAHLLKPQDPTAALYSLYSIAFQQEQCSFQSFVEWIVQSGVPLWFESSGIASPKDNVWQAIRQDGQRLAQHFIYRAQHQQDQKRRQEDDLSWLGEQDTTLKTTSDQSIWKDMVTGTDRPMDKERFTAWATATPRLVQLFSLIAQAIFEDKDTNAPQTSDEIHQKRVEGKAAPAIARPSGSMFESGRFSRLLSAYDYYMITQFLPLNALSWSPHEQLQRRTTDNVVHELIFSSRRDGTSWQVFVDRIVDQGATLVVIKAKDGSVFGGYADEPWMPVTDWYGTSSNFVFRLGPKDTSSTYKDDFLIMDVWDGGQATNDHFQYLCWGKKSLPNCLAMGGQFEYAGLRLDSDILHGESNASPTCSTFASPQLSLDPGFTVDEVEVFLLRPLLRDEDEMMEPKGGALSRTEDMNFMEMAGKKLYSRDLGEPERPEHDAE